MGIFQSQKAIVLFTGLALVLSASCSSKGKHRTPGAGDKIYPVAVWKIAKEEVPDIVELKGNFIPSDKLDVKAETEGKVISSPVTEGQQVNLGEALATINPEQLNLLLEKQKLELKEQEVKIEAGLANKNTAAKSPFMRSMGARPNADSNAPPPEQNPDNPPPTNPDQVGEDKPQQEPPPADSEPSNDKPDNADSIAHANEVTLDRIKADIALTEKKIESANVTAGIPGVLTKKNVSDGSAITLGEVLFQIVKIDPILLSVFVNKKEVVNLQKGQKVEVKTDDLSGISLNGEITYVAAEADPQNKNYEVRIAAPNTQLKIRAGMQGVAVMPQTGTRKALLVPDDAVLNQNGKKYVYVADGQLALRKEVELGSNVGNKVEVSSGLKDGETVIVKGHSTFKDEEEFIRVE